MTTISKLEKVLEMASKTLVKNKSIATTFCIRSKNAAISPVFIHPQWIDEADKKKFALNYRRFAKKSKQTKSLWFAKNV